MFSFSNHVAAPVSSRRLATDLPRIGMEYFFLADPDGILVEVVQDNRNLPV